MKLWCPTKKPFDLGGSYPAPYGFDPPVSALDGSCIFGLCDRNPSNRFVRPNLNERDLTFPGIGNPNVTHF
jgi:hypothetical protein